MLERALYRVAFSEEWGRQMRFITGPRQSGKTTVAKLKLAQEKCPDLYYLWDLRSVRNRYKENQLFFTEDRPPARHVSWVCFDEIHKIPKWKNALKAIFDSTSEHYRFVVTGSAKLDLIKKAGDSLSGRYFNFGLFPLSLMELNLAQHKTLNPPSTAAEFVQEQMDRKAPDEDKITDLLEFGGFPEPFLKGSKLFYAKWAQDYADTVIKEDVGALTRIIDKEHLFDLYNLLPEMVGNPISESSLASHLELSQPTIKNHLKRLADFYLAFKIPPYSKNIKRALLKAPKCYLYDWGHIKVEGNRFENFVAVNLLSRLSLWMNVSEDAYSLFYIRTKEKEETDFVILKNNKPWLLIEVKLSDGSIAGQHYKTQAALGGIPFIQVCKEAGVSKMESKAAYRLSASKLLG